MSASIKSKISEAQARQAVEAVATHGDNMKAAAALGVGEATIRRRLIAAKKYGIEIAAPAEQPGLSLEQQLQVRVKELEGLLKTQRSNAFDADYVRNKIIGLKASVDSSDMPTWPLDLPRDHGLPGVPTALLSDWHWGEHVFPKQVNGVNEFNIEIARRRAKICFEKIAYLLRKHVVQPEYPGIVVALGGDMLTGDIHDELSQTNDVPNMVALLDLFGVLKWGINELLNEFGRMLVPCVTGNHGRNTHKMQAKNRNFTNFDWLLYQFLARAFENDPRVKFLIPDAPDVLFTVAGHRYLLIHGDGFRGGDGIIGHYGPVLRGQKRLLARNSNIGLEFDTMLHGHFHTYFPTSRIIGNGSLKGMDEYSYQGVFGYEPPIQAMWLTHPSLGITIDLPIKIEAPFGRRTAPANEWVTWKEAA